MGTTFGMWLRRLVWWWLAALPAWAHANAAPLLREAFLYAYPYHEFMWLRDQALNNPQAQTHTTLHRFHHQRHRTTPADRFANGPIRDTLYSTAWLDLQAGPVLLRLPDTGPRYSVLVLIAANTESFASFGRSTTGTAARTVAVVGPQWHGATPAADLVVQAPTPDVYVNLRVQVTGPEDLAAARQVQDGFVISAPVAPVPQPAMKPDATDAGRMLDVMNQALARNPPPHAEAELLARYRSVGLCAGCRFADLPASQQAQWRAMVPAVVARLKSALKSSRTDMPRRQGWIAFRLPAQFGTRYAMRAGSAANSGGIFGLQAAEASYFMAVTDEHDEALGQGRRYRLRLPPGGLPAQAFWSVTLYEFVQGGQYLLANPAQRYHITEHTPGLARNADGSLDIFIQPEPPAQAAQRANWLPSPHANNFYLNARIYLPHAEVLQPEWGMPPLHRLPN